MSERCLGRTCKVLGPAVKSPPVTPVLDIPTLIAVAAELGPDRGISLSPLFNPVLVGPTRVLSPIRDMPLLVPCEACNTPAAVVSPNGVRSNI